ncbi:hypothetical protein ILUMI_03145 [Ignelater luminosus]|uniref:THAP-type domain-containing protein n=1 Tax=Ignelater luminosus TaxID=2038154 RepID=A0A8K0DGW7_IGNLU|nr:hypothetical protein ILUMI_03145 [Ignelater luminosus]
MRKCCVIGCKDVTSRTTFSQRRCCNKYGLHELEIQNWQKDIYLHSVAVRVQYFHPMCIDTGGKLEKLSLATLNFPELPAKRPLEDEPFIKVEMEELKVATPQKTCGPHKRRQVMFSEEQPDTLKEDPDVVIIPSSKLLTF